MNIRIERTDLTPAQLSRVQYIFKFYPEIRDNQGELMRRLVQASEEEFTGQLLNDGRISTISELYQYRLFLYVKHVFDWNIPSEFEVSQIFNIPNSSASTLIKNMRSRYQFELVQSFKDTLQSILKTIDSENPENINGENYYKLNIRSKQLVKEINELLAILNPNYEDIKKYNDISSYYKISEQTRNGLNEYINV